MRANGKPGHEARIDPAGGPSQAGAPLFPFGGRHYFRNRGFPVDAEGNSRSFGAEATMIQSAALVG